jgi:Flp pilus assembly protein TadG
VEFALLLPVLVLILFGIIEFGLILYDQAVITNASREGARKGILFATTRPTVPEIQAVVTHYTANNLVTFASGTTPDPKVPTGRCTALGNDLTVTVDYQYTFLILDGFGFTGPLLKARTTMRCE